MLASRFPGFVTVRHQVSAGTAQVWYENWQLAGEAQGALDGFQIAKGLEIAVTYADRSVQ